MIQEVSARNIYLYSMHHFTSSNCILMQLRGIVFIQLQGNDIFVNFQGNIFVQRTCIYSQKIYSFKKFIFVQGIIFISRKLYSFKETIFNQGNYINSRKYIRLRKLYSFREICSFKETIFIQQHCVSGHSRIIYLTSFPSHFTIIISFLTLLSL